MIDESKLVRRAPSRPLVWLGEREARSYSQGPGERFPAFPAKEKDLLFEPPARKRQ